MGKSENQIDMWYGDIFVKKKYQADATHYPHGSFGFIYRGNIYNENCKPIGDYAANDSGWIDDNFQIEWGD